MLPNVYVPQQLNPYTYTRNNPIKYVDPSGNFGVPTFLPLSNRQFAQMSVNKGDHRILHTAGYAVNDGGIVARLLGAVDPINALSNFMIIIKITISKQKFIFGKAFIPINVQASCPNNLTVCYRFQFLLISKQLLIEVGLAN